MDWEILRLVVLTLCQAATGYWGFHVSTRSWSARLFFGGITATGVFIIVWTGMADEAAKRDAAREQGRLEGKIDQIQSGQTQGFSRVIQGTSEIEQFLKIHGSAASSSPIPRPSTSPGIPDVQLYFYNPASPMLRLVNDSDTPASNIKWGVVVWNLDNPQDLNPLPIPFQTFDFVRPHREGGNEAPFSRFVADGSLKEGMRLFGTATVECPNCSKGHSYAIYIEWGKGGWYSPISGGDARIVVPAEMSQQGILKYALGGISSVPVAKRIPIRLR